MKRLFLLLVTCSLVASQLIACASATTSPVVAATPTTSAATAAPPKVTAVPTPLPPSPTSPPLADLITVGHNFVLRTFDPHIYYGIGELIVLRHVYEPLVNFNEAADKLEGALAESWSVSGDGKTWTFKLRPGVTFSDGQKLTAEAVTASFQRIKADTASGFNFIFTDFTAITAVDDLTVRVVTAAPQAAMLNNLSVVYILPPAVKDYVGKRWENAPGTGPYVITGGDREKQVNLEANPTYWQKGVPKTKRLVLRPIADTAARTSALLAGEIDLADNLTDELVAPIEKDTGYRIIRTPLWQSTIIGFNVTKGPLAIPKVRQALSYGIDRDKIVKGILPSSTPLSSYITKGVLGYDAKLPSNPYDIAKAKQLLAEAGYANGFDMTITLTPSQEIKGKEVTEFLVDQLKQLGIKLTIESVDGTTKLARYYAGQYDAYFTSSISVTGDPDRYLQERVVADLYKSGYKNQQIIDLIKQGASTVDAAQRQSIYEKMQELWWDDPPQIFLHAPAFTYAVTSKIQGFNPPPHRLYRLWNVTKAK